MAKKARRRTAPARTSKARGPGRPRQSRPAKANTLTGRLQAVAGSATFREVGEATGTHPENARRYLSGGSVSLEFLRRFAKTYNVSADWLLEGIGQQNRR